MKLFSIIKSSFQLVKFCPIFIVLCFFSCSEEKDQRKQEEVQRAKALLQLARESLHATQYEKTHLLIDSLRHSCPRATETRREALTLEDSLLMLEARAELAVEDSLRQKVHKQFEQMNAQKVSAADAHYRQTELLLDSLNMRCNKLHQKARFYERMLKERKK